MKSTLKLILALSLLGSIAFAEGDMTGGGKTCPPSQTCRPVQPTPTPDPADTDRSNTAPTDDDSFLTMIQNYLSSIFE